MTWWQKLEDRIFGYGTATTLGVYRILISFLALLAWLSLGRDVRAWFTDEGYVSAAALAQYDPAMALRWNPLPALSGNPGAVIAVYWLVAVAALCTMLGFQTRIAAAVLALGYVAFHHRNPVILNSGDTLIRQSLLILTLAPSGRALSLDAWIAAKKGRPLDQMVSRWSTSMLQFQMAVMYGTTVWHKTLGAHWVDGTASWYAAQLSEFQRFPMPAWFDAPPFLQIVTWGTLVIEVMLASTVFWKPTRAISLWLGVLLHVGIEYRMNIPFFAFICMTQYVTHFKGEEMDAFLARFKRKPSTEVAPAT